MNSYQKLENLMKRVSTNQNLDLLTEINRMAEEEYNIAKEVNPNYHIEDFFIDVYKVFGDDVLIEASVIGCCNSSIYVDFDRVFERISRSKRARGLPPASHGFF